MGTLAVQISFDIRNAMSTRRISQRELATRLNVSEARVCQMIDSGNLRLSTLERICDVLGLHVALK